MRTIIIILLALTIGNSHAQKLKVSFGELLPSKKGTKMLDAGIVGDKLFVVESCLWNVSIKFYSTSNYKLLSTKIIRQKTCAKGVKDCINNDFSYEKTIFLKDQVIMLFSSFERKLKQYTLFAQKINNDGSFDGKLTIIDKIDSKNRNNAGSFLTWQSKDSSKFMIIQNPPFEKYKGEKFAFKVYDSKLENLSNYSIALPYKDKNVSISDYFLGNDGTIYMLVDIIKEDKERGQDRSFYSILSLKGKDGELSEFDLKLTGKDIENAALRLDEDNNKVICSGLYSDISSGYTGKKIDGLFFLNIDMIKKEIVSKGFKSIENSVIAAILDISEKKVEKKSNASSASKYFEIMDVIPLSDGSNRIITEYRQLKVVSSRTCDANGKNCRITTTNHYYRKNIFVITLDKDGTITSFTDIPKYQHSVEDNGMFSSFLLVKKDDRTFFIYNDNPMNLNVKSIKDMKQMNNVNKACVVAVELNKDGSYTKEKIYDVAEKKNVMLLESGIEISKGQYIVSVMQARRMFSKLKMGIAKVSL